MLLPSFQDRGHLAVQLGGDPVPLFVVVLPPPPAAPPAASAAAAEQLLLLEVRPQVPAGADEAPLLALRRNLLRGAGAGAVGRAGVRYR